MRQLIWYTTPEEESAIVQLARHLEGRYRARFTENMTDEYLIATIETQSPVFLDKISYNA